MKVKIGNTANIDSDSQMKVGQIAEILGTSYNGGIVLRIYDGYVLLGNPKVTWGRSDICFDVVIFPTGTEVALTTEI